MSLGLRYFDDPVLRKKASEIQEITDEIRTLATQMIEIMISADGIGLAAPQVGCSVRLFVSRIVSEDITTGRIQLGEPRIHINPILSEPSDLMVERNEGCLSIPGLYLAVNRPFSILIESTDLQGARQKEKVEGYVARCMMHETDHLDGILFIDHVKGKKRTEAEPYLRRIKQKFLKK